MTKQLWRQIVAVVTIAVGAAYGVTLLIIEIATPIW